MNMLDNLFRKSVAGLATFAGTVLLAPLVLPAVARVARPTAKAVLHLYFDLINEVQEERAEFQSYKRREKKPGALATHALSEGAQELLVEDVEKEAEESATEALVETLGEVLE
jgi:hypothetical protein